MNISRIFILRPIMTTLVMFSILIVGLVAYRALPVSELPTVDFPTIRVSANLAGASPETMAAAVATVLEREFATIGGIDSMTSISSMGVTQVTIQFNLNRDIDAAAQDVQTAIAAATHHLPQNMTTATAYRKVNPAEQPILYLAMSSPTLPLSKVDDYADTHLAQRISMLSGVAEVQVYGSQKYAVRVRVDPKALISRAIGIDEVVAAIPSRETSTYQRATSRGPTAPLPSRPRGSLRMRRPTGPSSSLTGATPPYGSVRWRPSSTVLKTTRWLPGSTTNGPSSWPFNANPARTPSRSSRPSRIYSLNTGRRFRHP
ncbi:MAG: Acriflavine resistance protein [Thermodesulfobacteriota bacterium]|nr:Acriflavine resistance protein [Thermodesulfobacteriota bacterium]